MSGADSYYSFDTSLFFYPYSAYSKATKASEQESYQELYLHELTHWYQHHGTSVGAYLAAQKSALNFHIIDIVFSLDATRRSALGLKRKNGEVILPLFMNNEPNIDLFSADNSTWVGRCRAPAGPFLYYLVTSAKFFHDYSLVSKHLAPGDIVSNALLYVDHFIGSRLPSYIVGSANDFTIDAVADKITEEFTPLWYGSPDSKNPVDTEHLFECCAILIEIMYILYAFKGHVHEEESKDLNILRNAKTLVGTTMFGGTSALGRIEGLYDHYISPLRYASFLFNEPLICRWLPPDEQESKSQSEDSAVAPDVPGNKPDSVPDFSNPSVILTPVSVRDNEIVYEPYIVPSTYSSSDNWDFLSENAPTLIAAIEVALNPPLPPKFKVSAEKLTWSHIYPPLRYGLCLMAVGKVGKLRLTKDITREDVLNYMHKLAAAAGIPFYEPDNMKDVPDRFAECIDELHRDETNESVKERLYEEFDHFDFTLSCQRMFHELQKSGKNGMIIDLMLACFRGEPPHYDNPPDVGNPQLQRCLVPPVIIDTSDERVRAVSGYWPRIMSWWLVLKSAEEYALLELIASKGEIPFEAKLTKAEQESLNVGFMKIFGMLPW
jgi:hypothetical protein